jgi:signal transduction histidine kinase/ligand-binding sensor domain-containing protein
MKPMSLLLSGLLFLSTGQVWAAMPDLTLRQLNHRVYTAIEGAPTNIAALAQTSDGTLWIGSPAGLTRFDGVRFVPYPGPSDEPLPSSNVSALLATPGGGLWIGFRPGGVSLLKDGHVTGFDTSDGLPDGTVSQFALDRDGSIWAAPRLGLAHLEGKRWKKVTGKPQLDTPYGVLIDRNGTLWVATVDGLLARSPGDSIFREVDSRRYSDPAGVLLASSPDGGVWAASSNELLRIDQSTAERSRAVPVRGITSGPLLFDEGGNLWASDADAQGLIRVSSDNLSPVTQSEPAPRQEQLFRSDGWTSGRVMALLVDRERNVWVGTNTGLHRFSRTNVVRDELPPCYRGVFGPPAIVAGDNGTLWMACTEGEAASLNEIRDGAVVSRQDTPIFNLAYRDTEGKVWFAGQSTLAHLENRLVITSSLPPELQGRPVQAMVRDASGGIWISISRRGVFHLAEGKWSAYGNLDALPRVFALVAASDGPFTWLGYTNNRIARVTKGVAQMYEHAEGLDIGNVLAILAKDGEVWVGGELGFARFDGKHFVSIHSASTPFKGISGIVRARDGDFWLNGVSGIARISREEIERVVRDPGHRVKHETFDYLDGVPGTAVQLRPQPSAIETTDGRIWFSLTAGLISIDATRLVRNTLPPPVTIWSLTSGPTRYPNRGQAVKLPVHTTNLQIDYSAGSLTVPERVRFRYKLGGSDREWQEAGTRREALYTNLGPGTYSFLVAASNNDGVWNDTGAAMSFIIPPALHQTMWFYTFCAFLCIAILIASYRARVRQVAAQVRSRLEARLAERERIARDLHDTLLQGMQGLIFKFQAAADRIPQSEPARVMLEQSLDRADQLLGESRDKVKDLRPSARDVADLAQALATEGEQFALLNPALFRVAVEGECLTLHPIVREEGFLIAREALSNAFRHASAEKIEVEIIYDDATFRIVIRDDGRGLDPALLDEQGRSGHFGLIGMRERAKKLGATLEIWSKPRAGTEVDLRVPAGVAYKRLPTTPRQRWWRSRPRVEPQ